MINTSSPLYSPELAPIPAEKRNWTKWNLAALWVGMAVCIPTYILASYMIRSGLSWQAALTIIGLANLVITIPMVLNGHAGVKYGIPFPVFGRSAFGTRGIHLVSIARGIVACGWFGVQTWVGGLAFYSIYHAAMGSEGSVGLDVGKFVCFGLFWLVNMYFIWKGTESIRWLEDWSAPILILIGLILIGWGYQKGGSFSAVLDQGKQLGVTSALVDQDDENGMLFLRLQTLKNLSGKIKATEFGLVSMANDGNSFISWNPIPESGVVSDLPQLKAIWEGSAKANVKFRDKSGRMSSEIEIKSGKEAELKSKIWEYILWFTAMVGFWATMSISISDITRFAKSQNDQLSGQFMGLPGTMIFYSFVGIFVTCAAIIAFDDVLIAEDAPWDPVSLVAKFQSPLVVIFAQFSMIIATLSTNIAANVIAPANAFSNLWPKKISFRQGGYISGLVGILICPWWLMDEISGILVFISGLLGPVLGILLCDYFLIRKKQLEVGQLFETKGIYSYGGSGFNSKALMALLIGMFSALIGFWIPALGFLYTLSWFTGFFVSFGLYFVLMRKGKPLN